MKKRINIFKNTEELAHFFAGMVQTRSLAIPKGHYLSLALSGGKTPKTVFRYLVTHYKDLIAWETIRIFWSDERCVPPRDRESNYRMAKETLLDYIPVPAENIFRIRGEGNPVYEAIKYSETVRAVVPGSDNIPQFDILMLGLGDDGHTASIFPGNPDIFTSDKLFEVAEHPRTKQKRITVTGKVINHAHTVVFLVTGRTKAAMVSKVFTAAKGSENLPATHVHPVHGELVWLTDQQAAAQLNTEVK